MISAATKGFAAWPSRVLPLRPRFNFAFESTKKYLKQQLYSIDLINKSVNRQILAMAYSPGVGAICERVQQDRHAADTMTLRGRSVAIVTNGSILGVEGHQFMPAMDWFVAQVKYYSNYDPFPFVLPKEADLE